MAPIVAPGVCRYAVNGSYSGQDVVNIIDMEIDTTGSTELRSDACFSVAGIIMNEWTDSILPLLSSSYGAESVSWIDIDTLVGSTGERSSTEEQDWPLPGGAGGAPMPGSVAMRVNKNTISARGERQGRMYLCGMPEGYSPAGQPNTIDSGSIPVINDALESFLGDLNQNGDFPNGSQAKFVVVHTLEGEWVRTSDVESLTIDPYLSTQVRRLRR